MEKELRRASKVLISKKQLLEMIPLCERTIYNFEKQGNSLSALHSVAARSCGIWLRSRHGLMRANIPARPLAPEWGPELWRLT